MKKLLLIIFIGVLFVGCSNKGKELDDAIKFKEEYEILNGEKNSSGKEYLNMDIMAVQHHGINVHNEFTDFISVKTLLYPNFGIYGSFEEGQSWGGSWQASVERNKYLHAGVEESLDYLNGTVVLTFPYKVGEAKSLGSTRTDRADVSGDETRIQYY